MKNSLLLLTICSLFSITTIGQTKNVGLPKGIEAQIDLNAIEALPAFDQVSERQNLESLDKQVYIFGKNFTVDYDLHQNGAWTTLDNGDKIWQLEIVSTGARSLNFILDQYELPEGAELFIYDQDHKNILGAYTAENNNPSQVLGTELVYSDHVTIELYEPAKVAGQSKINIGTITHGLRGFKPYVEGLMKDLNDAGDCNIDVNCPLGTGWENERNSVALIISGGNTLCSGALVNNTNNDGTPYFLTANHCGTNPTSWVFRFRWESTAPQCATTSPSGNGPTQYESTNGAVLRATNTGSDFMLCELNTAPNASWDVFYAGWDRTDNIPSQTTGIHHPSGDIKKICRDDDAASQTVWSGAECWEVSDWDQGVTEGGSSGSPLFDQNHRIIGQLYGGTAACAGTVDNGDPDFYGRFAVSWDGGSAVERLRDWLDPTNTGVQTLDGYNPLTITNNDDVLASNVSGINSSYCGSNVAAPEFTFRNNGFNTLTNVELTVNIDGTLHIFNWTGSLASGDYDTYAMGGLTLPDGDYTILLYSSNPNGTIDENLNNDTIYFPVSVKSPGYPLTMAGRIDCQGDEIDMQIEDNDGTVDWTLPSGTFTGGVLIGETFSFDICVSEPCNTIEISDAGGDGWNDQNNCFADLLGIGLYVIDGSDTVSQMNTIDFGSSLSIPFCLNGLDVNQLDEVSVALYPNPFQEQLTISADQYLTQITIWDTKGALIQQYNRPAKQTTLTTQNWSKGMYIIRIESDNTVITKKVIKQ